jgi:hypothetical protein
MTGSGPDFRFDLRFQEVLTPVIPYIYLAHYPERTGEKRA